MPDTTCNSPVRGGGLCSLEAGHTRSHSTVTFGCDGCGKVRRGYPAAVGPDGEYAGGIAFCWLCLKIENG